MRKAKLVRDSNWDASTRLRRHMLAAQNSTHPNWKAKHLREALIELDLLKDGLRLALAEMDANQGSSITEAK